MAPFYVTDWPVPSGTRDRRRRYQWGFNSAPPLALQAPPAAQMTPTVVITIGGIISTSSVDMNSITIEDVLNEQPNTCNFKMRGTTPSVGQSIQIGLGSIDPDNLIFGGVITQVTKGYDAITTGTLNISWQVACTDFTFLLNRRRPTGQFVLIAADVVIRTLFTSFSSGFDTAQIPTGLPLITISFDGSQSFAQCMTNICNLIGYHFKVSYSRVVQVFIALPNNVFAATLLKMNPIGYWRLGESVGAGTAIDASGYGHNGTYIGGVTLGQPGALGDDTAALFDGVNGTVTMGDLSTARFTGPFSIVAFVKMTATSGLAMIVSKSSAPAGYGIAEFSGSGQIQFFAYTTAPAAIFDFFTPLQYNDGYWHLVVATFSGTTAANGAKIYVDRALVVQATAAAGTIGTPSAPLRISGWNTALAGPFGGAIDEVAILNYELTAAQVAALQSAALTDPLPIDVNNVTTMNDPMVSYDMDLSQVRTSVIGRGAASSLLSDILDDETLVPVDSVTQFNMSGGRGYLNHVPITYSGTTPAAGGSFVGQGASPASPPVVAAAVGTGMSVGTYKYAYTDITASGESIPSPLATVVTFTLSAPPSAPVLDFTNWTNFGGSLVEPGRTITWYTSNNGSATFDDPTNQSSLSPGVSYVGVAAVTPGYTATPTIAWVPSTDPNVKWTSIWFQNDSGPVFLWTSFAPPSNGPIRAGVNGTSIMYPGANPDSKQVQLTSVAVGTSPTTSRKVYRTAVNGSQLKLVTTIPNNTSTSYLDALADGSLGANAPVTDTSGLVASPGTVAVGSSTVPVSSLANFNSLGGWAVASGVPIRFTGISSVAITGVPASGPGSVTTPISYGQSISPVPSLIGVVGAKASSRGNPVGILIIVNDLAAQSALALIEGGDGVHEFQFTDTTVQTENELTQVCTAQLLLFRNAIISMTESARDTHTKAGHTLVVTLPAPLSITASLLIQSVSISHVGTEIGQYPLYSAKASNVKFTLQDLLRQLGGLIPEV